MIDFLTVKNLVVFIFFLVYALIVMKYDRKTYFVWGGIIAILILGALSPFEAFAAINWNVIGIYFGMLFVAESLLYSKLPDALASKIVGSSKRTWIAMLGVCFLSGLLSSVLENVAVVLITAPIALAVSKKLKTNPAPLVIGIALMSNLQGVATMIGDPPSLLVAYYAKLNFNDFFIFHGKPSLFFAVQIGAIAALGVLYFFFRKNNQAHPKIKAEKVKSIVPGVILLLLVVLLAIASFVSFKGSPELALLNSNKLGLISVACGALIAVWQHQQDKKEFVPMVKRLDWGTGLFLIGIFILVESLIKIGFMQDVAMFIGSIVGSDVFIAYLIIVAASVAFSAFIDNVPFVAAMLPVTGNLAQLMGVSAYPLYFGLVLGASIGGNITPVGASANVVAMGILKKKGHQPTFFEFVKMGLPFTMASVIASTAFIWLMFG